MLLVPEQRTTEWYSAHLGRITAGIAAACLRLDPNTSAQEAWRGINGNRKEVNSFMRWGISQEPEARRAYEVATGQLVEETGFWIWDEEDWLGASPDGLAGEGLVEIKCPIKELQKKVPAHHRIQMIVQMIVTGRPWCDYFAWTPRDYYLERVYPQGVQGLIRRLDRFRREYVLTGTEPPRKKPARRRKKPLDETAIAG